MNSSKRLLGSVLVAAVLLVPAVAAAERVALLPASGINIHEGYLSASQDIFRGHLLSTRKYEVIVIPGTAGQTEVSAPEAIRAAREIGADLAVVIHITRLGSKARVRLTAYSAASGYATYHSELQAATPDDIDPVLARLAKGLASGQPATDTADIETVTEQEADPLRKRTATNVFGLKLGFVSPQNRYDDGEPILPGAAVFWLYDARSFLAELDLGFHAKDGDGDFTVGIATYYPFERGNVSPFIGGGLKYGFVNYGGDGASGLILQVGGGVLIGRLSTVQLRADAHYFISTFREDDDKEETGDRLGHGVVASVGIGF